MQYHIIINSIKSVTELKNAWSNDDFIELLDRFGFEDGKNTKPEELEELLFMAISDFEPEEAEKLKQKFFREAESAGTLSHPNIVTIYDAGDEQDLAYIAMEFLDGEDFQKYTKKKASRSTRCFLRLL